MAARGLVPMPPRDTVTVLSILTHDEDEKVRLSAQKSLSELPERMFQGAIKEALHPLVLDQLARSFENNEAYLETILLNKETPDETFAFVADRVNETIRLGPLPLAEMREMILHRIAKAAAEHVPPRIFTPGAFRAIHRATGGYPRKVVNLCHKLVMAMILQDRREITRAMVQALAKGGSPARSRKAVLAVAAGLLLAALAGGALLLTGNGGRLLWPFAATQGVGQEAAAAPAVETAAASPAGAPAPALAEPGLSAAAAGGAAPGEAKPAPEVVPPGAAGQPYPAVSAAEPAPSEFPAETAAAGQPAAVVEAPAEPQVQGTAPAPVPETTAPLPQMLGRVTLARGETISELISFIYGAFTMERLRAVGRANPGLGNPDRVPAGTRIAFPALKPPRGARPPAGWIVRLARETDLAAACDRVRGARRAGAGNARLLVLGAPGKGLDCQVVLGRIFPTQEAAAGAAAKLPAGVARRAEAVRLDVGGAALLTDVGSWK